MQNVKTMLYYEARITFGFASLLSLIILPVYMLISWIIWETRGSNPSLTDVTRMFELLLTLSGGLASAHLMTIEREENFDTIRRTYPESSSYLPIIRTLTALMLIVVSGFVGGGIFYLAHGEYDLNALLLPAFAPAFAPAFYLCALALLVNNISGNYWVSSGFIIAYWLGEFISSGEHTGILYLFNHSLPNGTLDADLNRALLLIFSLILITVNIAFSTWRRRR